MGDSFLAISIGFEGWARRQEPSEGIGHRKEDPIYFFPEMKLRGLSPNFHIYVFLSDLSIPTIGPLILLQCGWKGIGRWFLEGWLA
jgi:hypothetical protein